MESAVSPLVPSPGAKLSGGSIVGAALFLFYCRTISTAAAPPLCVQSKQNKHREYLGPSRCINRARNQIWGCRGVRAATAASSEAPHLGVASSEQLMERRRGLPEAARTHAPAKAPAGSSASRGNRRWGLWLTQRGCLGLQGSPALARLRPLLRV